MFNEPEIQHKLKKLKSVVADIALEHNLVTGHRDYTKFIILSRSRTGSNLLTNLLQSHQNMRLFYELFSKNYKPKKFWEFINQDFKKLYQIKQDNPVIFLNRLVFREMPKYISAVGFKLFYYHAQKEKERAIWNYLKDSQEIKIIHLKRKNILKTYVSQQTAFKTGDWVSKGKLKPIDCFPINLDYNLVLKAFEQTRQKEREAEKFFGEHQVINIIYEDIVKDYAKETKRIQDFLNVDYQPLYIFTRKQSKKSLAEQIHNYEELKVKFSNTPWEEFFE